MSQIPTFWSGNHPLTAIANNKFGELVKSFGQSDSVQGELLRASTKISYDWFNNGWGCNNWSGAVVYIQQYFSTLPVLPDWEVIVKLTTALDSASCYSHGEPVGRGRDERIDQLVTTIHEIVVQSVLDNPTLLPNTVDMHTLAEEDYRDYAREEEENDY